MPNCFQLFRKSDPKTAVVFTEIDKEICQALNVPCHPTNWFAGWYDFFGWKIAVRGLTLGSPEMTKAIDEILERNKPEDEEDVRLARVRIHQELTQIHEYLTKNYTSSAWAEIGRRR